MWSMLNNVVITSIKRITVTFKHSIMVIMPLNTPRRVPMV
jgi:hypothetical protein